MGRVDWLFLSGGIEQCADATARSGRLLALRDRYRDQVQQARASGLLLHLIDHLFEVLVISIPRAAAHLNVTYHTARGQVSRLADSAVLRHIDNTRPLLYRPDEIISIVQ